MSAAAAVITKPTFMLADRMRIQRERITAKEFRSMGMLLTIVQERQMSTAGLSSSRPRFSSPEGAKYCPAGFEPFSEWQAKAWVKLTLDWLHPRKAPVLAISPDRNDLLLPMGLTPLPDIPDPTFTPRPALVGKTVQVPRIPQTLEERACGRIRERNGRWWLVFQPLTEILVAVGGKESCFGRIVCGTDPADRTHAALLVDPDRDETGNHPAHFVGGSFHAAM